MMDLKDFDWPEISDIDMAFSTLNTNEALLSEAKERGFLHGKTEWNKKFCSSFFSGGDLYFMNLKKDPQEWHKKALRYMKALSASFEPKHEHKEAVCAMILSEICENSK